MKKYVGPILSIISGIVFIGLAFNLFDYVKLRRLDAPSSAYANDAISAIFTNLDYHALVARANPLLLEITPEEKIKEQFAYLAPIGKLKNNTGCQGEAGYISVTTQQLMPPTLGASYICALTFEKTSANVQLFLSFDESTRKWGIMSYEFNSEPLTN